MISHRCASMGSIAGIFVIMLSLVGCAGLGHKMKSFLGGKSGEAPVTAKSAPRYSDTTNLTSPVRRQYRRITKRSLEDESALQPGSGSLWVMEGQGAYLFSQNIMRMIGDPLAVSLEGEPREQVQNKVDIIRTLMARFEERQRQRRLAALEENQGGKKKAEGKGDADKAKSGESAEASGNKAAEGQTGEPVAVKIVPTRVVERTVDGNYRVKGSQPFMIGNREYKVIVTGIVRAEDFNDEGIPAAKLMDGKFDVVSARQKEQAE